MNFKLNYVATLWLAWATACLIAHIGKADNPTPNEYQQHAPADQININKVNNNKANFKFKGKITTHMDIADLVITFDRANDANTSETIIQHLMTLRPLIQDDWFIDKAIKMVESIHSKSLNHQLLLQNMAKRGIWTPAALVTSLLGAGLSMAALASSAANKNNIKNLERRTDRIFKVHESTLNQHSQQIETLATLNRRIMDDLNLIHTRNIKTEIIREIKEYKAATQRRTDLLQNLLTGHVPLSILDTNIMKATSDILKTIRKSGQTTFEEFKPVELVKLPFTVGNLDNGLFNIHFHIPTFTDLSTDVMDIYQLQDAPWILTSKEGIKFVATPTPADQKDSIIVQGNDNSRMNYTNSPSWTTSSNAQSLGTSTYANQPASSKHRSPTHV